MGQNIYYTVWVGHVLGTAKLAVSSTICKVQVK